MDLREVFSSIKDVVDSIDTQDAKSLSKGMVSLDSELSATADPSLMETFLSLVDRPTADLGYDVALKFAEKLVAENKQGGKDLLDRLNSIGKAGYERIAGIRLAQSSYALIHWLMYQLSRINKPCHQLDDCTEKFTPMLQTKEGKIEPNPYFTAYTRMVLAKPDAANDGYTNISSFLLESADETAQTILIRMGRCLWETLYPMFSLYNPHGGDGETADVSVDESKSFDGGDIAGFIPLFIFLGLRIDFILKDRKLSCNFPFHPINPTCVEVKEDGKTILRLDYLDDCEDPQKVLDGLSVLEAIVTSPNVVVRMPL